LELLFFDLKDVFIESVFVSRRQVYTQAIRFLLHNLINVAGVRVAPFEHSWNACFSRRLKRSAGTARPSVDDVNLTR
jgi:hypothetical protein